jgi:poly(beta-D-mannuronate) lyase
MNPSMINPRPRILCGLLLLFGPGQGSLCGREAVVRQLVELQRALNAARPGDLITLKNGEWKDAVVSIDKGGSARNPLEIRAESPGGVTFTGGSSLVINAPYVTVTGMLFNKGGLKENTNVASVIEFRSHHGIVNNSAIVDYNPASFDTKYYWVWFSGDNNVVDHCYFKGKSNLDPVIGNDLEESRHNSVRHSYFKDIPYAKGNGREIIRVWGSGKYEQNGDDGAFFTIEGNLFDHADGEGAEIISLKSNQNTVIHNTVVASLGCINIRRGNFNTVKENIILGQGLAGARGFRMSGEHNLVQGNFASGCEYGIEVSCGEHIASSLTADYHPNLKTRGVKKEGTSVPTYPQNKDVTIIDNVMVGHSGADLAVGSDYKAHWPESQQVLLPEECIIKNNRFIRPNGGVSVIGTVPGMNPPLDRFTFKPNQYLGNVLIGGACSFVPAAGGFKAQRLPPSWSESRELGKLKPLTPLEVGPDWVRGRKS